MGKAEDTFAEVMLSIVTKHAPDFDATRMELRASSGGNYLSITCTIVAQSKPQLDAIYMDLTAHPMVKVAL
jgi:putative lipoic acid-binding regulatory protein